MGRQAAEGERHQDGQAQGQDDEEDVGGVDAHGELLRGGGGGGRGSGPYPEGCGEPEGCGVSGG
nr:MAG TPA: hypothetical protein [Caudoviricetes sp.]